MIPGNQARGPCRGAANATRRENPRAGRNQVISEGRAALVSCNVLLGGVVSRSLWARARPVRNATAIHVVTLSLERHAVPPNKIVGDVIGARTSGVGAKVIFGVEAALLFACQERK